MVVRVVPEYDIAVDLPLTFPRPIARSNSLNVRDVQRPALVIKREASRIPPRRNAPQQLAVRRFELDESDRVIRAVRDIQPVPIAAHCHGIWRAAKRQM